MNGIARVCRASACLLGLWLSASAGAQTTFHVAGCGDDSWSGMTDICQGPDGPKATIQAAIDAAADGDTVLVLPGTYTGAGNRNLVFLGKAIRLRSRDGWTATAVDLQGLLGTDEANFVTLHSGEGPGTLIEGFAVVGGVSENLSMIDLRNGASLTLRGCMFENNQTWDNPPEGGIVKALGCEVTIEDCQFYGQVLYSDGYEEELTAEGGFVYSLNASLTIRGCVFDGGWADRGGAVRFDGYWADGFDDLVIERTVFEDQSARSGGGIFVTAAGLVRVADCTFTRNLAYHGGDSWGASYAFGGGAWVRGDRVEFLRTTFRANRSEVYLGNDPFAGGGGAEVSADQSALIAGCLFADNTTGDVNGQAAVGSGGGLSLWVGPDASATLVGSTVAGNRAGLEGAGLHIAFAGGDAEATGENLVVYANDADNLATTGTGILEIAYSDIEGGYPGDGNIDADPLFVDAPNADYRLGAGSPCIDAGDNAAVPLGFPTDLNADPRFRDDPATGDTGVGIVRIVDMGAYEYQPGPFCAADFNDDGVVNTIDMLRMLNAWGAGEATADLNADGQINTLDVLEYLGLWAAGC